MAKNDSLGAFLESGETMAEVQVNHLPNNNVPAFHCYEDLPPELREIVLFYALFDKEGVIMHADLSSRFTLFDDQITVSAGNTLWRGVVQKPNRVIWVSRALNLFLVSKPFFQEAAKVFFRKNDFRVAFYHPTVPPRHAPRDLGGRLRGICGSPQSPSILHRRMPSFDLKAPMDQVTCILVNYGRALADMINNHSLRRLTITIVTPKLPDFWTHGDSTWSPESLALQRREGGTGRAPRSEATCLPSVNRFLYEGLPRLVALLTNPRLEHASLLVDVRCHPKTLCAFHRGGMCEDKDWLSWPHGGNPSTWGLRQTTAMTDPEVPVPRYLELDLRGMAEMLKGKGGEGEDQKPWWWTWI